MGARIEIEPGYLDSTGHMLWGLAPGSTVGHLGMPVANIVAVRGAKDVTWDATPTRARGFDERVQLGRLQPSHGHLSGKVQGARQGIGGNEQVQIAAVPEDPVASERGRTTSSERSPRGQILRRQFQSMYPKLLWVGAITLAKNHLSGEHLYPIDLQADEVL